VTVLVGVRCSDGVVIGSDSIATSSMGPSPLLHLPSNSKIQIFQDSIILATTGAVGFSQRLTHHVGEAISGGVFKNLKLNDCMTNISRRLLTDFQNSMVQKHHERGIGFGGLMAFAAKDEPCLVEYATTDFQPEIKQDKLFFVSMGSGQLLADPFLVFVSRVLWKNTMPTVDQARFGVYWVLDHTIKLAPGGVGGPIKMSELRKTNGTWCASELPDTQEPAQYISELEEHIGKFALTTIEEAKASPLPAVPALDGEKGN
jgi:hypothetical protein